MRPRLVRTLSALSLATLFTLVPAQHVAPPAHSHHSYARRTPTSTRTVATRPRLPHASHHPMTDATSTDTPDWACIRNHESGDDYQIGGDEPYGGAYQFSVTTWQGLGFAGVPNAAPPAVQDAAALVLYAWDLKYTGDPWYAWETAPACGL